MLAAGAAVLVNGQLLAPSTALAEATNGPTCSNVTWFDQFTCPKLIENLGGGKDEDDEVKGEVIHVSDPKCGDVRVICVPVGTSQTDRPFDDPDNRAPVKPGRWAAQAGGKYDIDPDFVWDPDLTNEKRHELCLQVESTISEQRRRKYEVVMNRIWRGVPVNDEEVKQLTHLYAQSLAMLRKKKASLKCGPFWS
jgi:hypothetical protein